MQTFAIIAHIIYEHQLGQTNTLQ